MAAMRLMASWATTENDVEFNGRGTKSFDLEEEVSTLELTMKTMNELRRSNLLLESSILRRERAESELLQLAISEESTAVYIGAFD